MPIEDSKLEINVDESDACEDDPKGSMDIEVECESGADETECRECFLKINFD